MTRLSRGDYAEKLVPYARQLVDLVHGDGGRQDVARLLSTVSRLPRPADVEPLAALAVVLAALAPARVDPARALAWINWEWQESA